MSRLPKLLAAVAATTLLLTGPAHAQDEPSAAVFTPTTRAGVEVGVPLLVTGSSFSTTPEAVVATELTFDGGATWVTTERVRVLPGSRTDWRHTHTPRVAGDLTIAARAVTAAGAGATGPAVTVHVGGATVPQPLNCPVRCEFVSHHAPEVDDTDTSPVEVGVRVRFDRPGLVLGASLLRGAHRGPIALRMWSGDGGLLAEREWDHPGRMAEIDFPTPVPVEPGRDYVVSYYTPQGGYATSEHYFTGTVVRAPFTAPHDGTHGAGVYRYGVGGGFPIDSWHDSTYWVQPEFRG
ncbi:DUF4082 domain-containing protein [Saccharothrix xinjiangensis]|uniref:DUF4082 domain-containing protein n=1 Tax=Saccharothrix xinjiangensis TaxID=204798 RepID=A0ABV9XVA3_9PSEU